jgi:hypothetical protein
MSFQETVTSKLVFEKRRNGELDLAYELGQKLISQNPDDEWNKKALAWCLIDLIKREEQSEERQKVSIFAQQLKSIEIADNDEVLLKSRNLVLSRLKPNAKIIENAKQHSKNGEFEAATRLYKSAFVANPTDIDFHESYAWDIYRFSKQLLESSLSNVDRVKRNINDYLHLTVSKPSLLHSLFLQLAIRCNKEDKLRLLSFLPLWNLDFLSEEDWKRYIDESKKEFPSKAEVAIQRAAKEATTSKNTRELEYLLPYVDSAMKHHMDNQWLLFSKAKILMSLGKYDEAFSFAIGGVRAKVNEYWAWELLGDVCLKTKTDHALSCYCKSLMCSADINFTAKVRLKLASLLVSSGLFENAKCEVQQVISYREKEGQKIPKEAIEITNLPWYPSLPVLETNVDFYKTHFKDAEHLLLDTLPWRNACIGESYVLPGKDGKNDKLKRTIYIQSDLTQLKSNINEDTFPFKKMSTGAAIKVKGDLNEKGHFKILALEGRSESELWDIFPAKVAVISHINEEKKLISFIIDRNTAGVLPLSTLKEQVTVGDLLKIKLFQYKTDKGPRQHILTVNSELENKTCSMKLEFSSEVRAENNMGFTSNDVFIHPGLMKNHCIENDDQVDGVAVLSLNEKRNTWGWKAVRIDYVKKAEKGIIDD